MPDTLITVTDVSVCRTKGLKLCLTERHRVNQPVHDRLVNMSPLKLCKL